jgi:hypothetical protein
VLVSLDHLDIVDYYEGDGQGFAPLLRWLDERGYHGTDWCPHDAKIREVGSPGARMRIETLVTLGRKPELVPNEDLNAGRKTIPFARFDKTRTAQGLESLRAYRTEREGEGIQEDARAQLGLARRGRVAILVALVARADARAGAGEGAHRPAPAGHDHRSIHGHRRRLIDAGGKGLAASAMRDGVRDRTALLAINRNNNN